MPNFGAEFFIAASVGKIKRFRPWPVPLDLLSLSKKKKKNRPYIVERLQEVEKWQSWPFADIFQRLQLGRLVKIDRFLPLYVWTLQLC